MRLKRSIGLLVGYLLLLSAVALLANAVKVLVTAILAPTAPAWAVAAALMVHGGGVILLWSSGKLVHQRVRHPGPLADVNLDWGRVLGP